MSDTGKIEYAPDYKSEQKAIAVINAETDREFEHYRLINAVVAAAREWHDKPFCSDSPLWDAVDALKEFEAEHGIQEETQGR